MFDAFISYSHAADGKLAAAVQHGLHRFAKPLFKLRAIRVFRDQSTLAMTLQLWPEIEKALRSSRFFILMADPLSAQSEWVQKEVACWVGMKRTEKMLIVWTGGDVIWDKTRKDFAWDKTTALPALLVGTFGGEEPLYQDLRWAREEMQLSRKHPKFADTLAKLSAAIRGQSLDEIYGDDVREQRRRLRFLWTGITILLLALLLAGWGWWAEFQARNAADEQTRIANEHRNAAEEQARIAESRRLAAESSTALAEYPQRSLLLAVEALRTGESIHGTRIAAAEQSLREALSLVGGRPIAYSDAGIDAVAISPDNHWLVTGSWDGTARLWDLTAKDPSVNPVVLRGHDHILHAVAISPDNHWLVTGGDGDHTARLWNLRAKDPSANPAVLRGHDGSVKAVAISSDNNWLVTGSGDHTARLWNLRAKDPSANPVVLRGHDNDVTAVAISPDNHWLVTGSADNTARLWDLRVKDPSARPVVLRGHESLVNAVAISPDNHWLVTGSADSTGRLWDLTAKDPSANPVVLRGHDNDVDAVAISPDSHWVVTGSRDYTARLWDLTSKDPSANPVILRGHDRFINTVAISPDNHWLVTGSEDHTARLWNLSAKDFFANPVVLHGHNSHVNGVTFSPDNHWLVTGSGYIVGPEDNTVRLWDLRAKDPSVNPVILRGHNGPINAVAISPDNHWLVTGSGSPWLMLSDRDGTARLWDLRAKADPMILRVHEGPINAVAISLDNHWLVTGSGDNWGVGVGRRGDRDNTARLWDLTAKDPSANPVILQGHDGSVNAVAISPDNHWLVTGGGYGDNTARLWDVTTKDPSANPVILRGHDSSVNAVAISPDNHWLVTGSEDKTARLWDLSADDPAANPVVLRGHEDAVYAVAISPDNHWLVTGSWDKTVRLWDLSAKDPAANSIVLIAYEG